MDLWEAVADRGTDVQFAAGQALVHHGESNGPCYAIKQGEVLVTATSSRGTTVVLDRRGPGSVIGEIAALTGAARPATVAAMGPVVAARLDAGVFVELLTEFPGLALDELRRVAGQLSALSERFTSRSDDVNVRVVQLLTTHRDATGDAVFASTRSELANWVGTTRESVTRALRSLEAQGTVALSRGAVELLG